MRIIAGKHRSRKLIAPAGLSTRPMPDRVRESIFGMLGTRIKDAAVVDLFSGSGAIGLEAISRGAASCLMVDFERAACSVIQQNVELLKAEDRCRVVMGDALGQSVVARCPRPVDLVFLDPPYPMVIDPVTYQRVKQQAAEFVKLLADDGFLILRTPHPFFNETDPALDEPLEPGTRSHKPFLKGRPDKYRRERKRWEDVAATSPNKGSPAPSKRGKPIKDEHGDADFEGEGEWIMRIDDDSVATRHQAAESAERARLGAAPVAGQPGDGVRVIGPEVPAVVKVPGDLRIEGAKGPETHVYGTTAVHWYMRAR